MGITERIDAALKAEAVAFDKDMQSVAREVLQEWADRKHRAYSLYAKVVLANGAQPESDGAEPDHAGMSRIAPFRASK